MSKAVFIRRTGGPEVLSLEDVEIGSPGPGQVRLRQTAIGLNYIDTYLRSGLYPLPRLPVILGSEAAGVVEEVGEGVEDLSVGDRVAYAAGPGAYAEERLIAADRVVAVPEDITDMQAAAMMLKGMTVEYLLRRTYPIKAGERLLFHAAAGGVGLIACQWACHLGAIVIGTVSSAEKAELAQRHGCTHTILYTRERVPERVRELTEGAGVPVVYDSVGRDTFADSLDCLATRGMLVSFGQSSGPVPPIGINVLSEKGSLFLTRPSLVHYTAAREDLLASAAALFEVVRTRAVKIEIGQTYPLAEVRRAHEDLHARKTTGSTVLLV